MADSKKELNKDVYGEQKRDADGKFVANDADGNAGTVPAADAGSKKEPVKVTVNKPEQPGMTADNKPAKEQPAPAKTDPEPAPEAPKTPAPDASSTEDNTNPAAITANPEPAPAAEPAPTTEPAAPAAGDPEKTVTAGDLSKLPTADLLKSMGDIVKAGVAEAIKPLEERLKVVEGQPAENKVVGSYTNVEKATTEKSQVEDAKSEFDRKYARAQELAANPSLGTAIERMQLGAELRKLSRLMDPASRAKHAAVKASFQAPDAPGFIEK